MVELWDEPLCTFDAGSCILSPRMDMADTGLGKLDISYLTSLGLALAVAVADNRA